jgi:serine/threonine protein kinase
VYKARDRVTRNVVALKKIILHHEKTDGFPLTSLREISTLKQLSSHPNIVSLYAIAVSNKRSGVFLVFELCDFDIGCLLDKHFVRTKKSAFKEGDAKRLILQLLSAMTFVHERHILHRDLKTSNLLYDSRRGRLKLADFGLARRANAFPHARDACDPFASCLTPKVVSLWYRPVELIAQQCSTYGAEVDNWGVGCIIAELISGKPLFKGKDEIDQLSKIFATLGVMDTSASGGQVDPRKPLFINPLPEPHVQIKKLRSQFSSLSAEGLFLIERFLEYDVRKRLTSKQALGSPYLTRDLPHPTREENMPRFANL